MEVKEQTKELEMEFSRRKFLKGSTLLVGAVTGTAGIISAHSQNEINTNSQIIKSPDSPPNEILYNGISLPTEWPPRYMDPKSYDPMPVPYLVFPPKIIPVDLGRQLFVDDFLIEYTNLKRNFHQPTKFEGNPILKPETKYEMNEGYCPIAAPFSDGCFYDPVDNLFKMWYMAGWFDGTALATSSDGINWERPKLDVVSGTNLVIAPKDNFRRDGVSVWLDHDAKDLSERFKMYYFAREGKIGGALKPVGGFLLKSADGIHWNWCGKISGAADNNTFFYNPFRRKWVFTIRRENRPTPPWSNVAVKGEGRARSYWESNNFDEALNQWKDAVFWLGADRLDTKRTSYNIGEDPQIYKVDAVGYESLLLGLIQVHYGPSNEVCAKEGFPKLTELQIAFSRDGFHWDRNCRKTFIGGNPDKKESWERAYIHSVGGVCNIVNDKLHFYYTAFKGNESNRNSINHWNGMYANASTGVAILRRDGFASMEAENEEKFLLTRQIIFKGKYLFVNIDASFGALFAEICGEDGIALAGFSRSDCVAITSDSTKCLVRWHHSDIIQSLSGKPVRLKFYLTNAKLYSFWISHTQQGLSGGAAAAGGPGFNSNWDL